MLFEHIFISCDKYLQSLGKGGEEVVPSNVVMRQSVHRFEGKCEEVLA